MNAVTRFLGMVTDGIGLWAGSGSDDGLGLVMSGLAGIAAALAVAVMLTVYARKRRRGIGDIRINS